MDRTRLSSIGVLAANAVLLAGCVSSSTIRVSVDNAGVGGNGDSTSPSISADGRYVAFESTATNLAPPDTNRIPDIFVRDNRTGHVTRVSVNSFQQQATGVSYSPFISGNGRFVAFESKATNLVPGGIRIDPLGSSLYQTYVRDLQNRTTVLANVSSSGEPGNAGFQVPERPSLSADGRYVAFVSDATNLVAGDTHGTAQIYVHDFHTGETSCVSVDSSGHMGSRVSDFPSISADGRYVVFRSLALDLIPNETNKRCTNHLGIDIECVDVFVHDRVRHLTTRASVNSSGVRGNEDSIPSTTGMSISADGRYVVFTSQATNLVPDDTNYPLNDAFVHDNLTGVTQRVNLDFLGHQEEPSPEVLLSPSVSISPNGRYVVFDTNRPLTRNSPDRVTQTYVRDLRLNKTELVSVRYRDNYGADGWNPVITATGDFVAFASSATDIVPFDINRRGDVFVRPGRCGSDGDCVY